MLLLSFRRATTIARPLFTSGLLIIFCGILSGAYAQEVQRDVTGWFYWENEVQLKDNWKIRSDIHSRSTDQFEKLGNLLLRGWIDYSISDFSFGLGYVYLGSWDDDTGWPKDYFGENRPFQQVQHEWKINDHLKSSQRIRLEQRFFNAPMLPDFSLRSRYSVDLKYEFASPILRQNYLFVENEFFLNMVGQSFSGGRLFEQNRVYLGYGFNPKGRYEIELGSYYEYQHDALFRDNYTTMLQLKLRTSF